jgi:hypothetical protein
MTLLLGERHNSCCRNWCVIVWGLGEEVVRYVVRRDVVGEVGSPMIPKLQSMVAVAPRTKAHDAASHFGTFGEVWCGYIVMAGNR